MSLTVGGLTIRRMVPDENGNYTEMDDLPNEKRKEIREKLTKRMGAELNRIYSNDPELFRKHIKLGIVKDISTK